MVASPWTRHPSAIPFEEHMCEECKLPREYCESSSSCSNSAKVAEKMDKMKLESDADGKEQTAEGEENKKKDETKKKKKEKKKCITITLTSRNRRKMITNVQGFEHFASKFPDGLKEVAKSFGKKFACGCSVTKGATNQDEIDLQGEYGEQIKEILVQKWKMEEELVVVVDKSKK